MSRATMFWRLVWLIAGMFALFIGAWQIAGTAGLLIVFGFWAVIGTAFDSLIDVLRAKL